MLALETEKNPADLAGTCLLLDEKWPGRTWRWMKNKRWPRLYLRIDPTTHGADFIAPAGRSATDGEL